MNERLLLVLGAGGHGKAVAEAALLSGLCTHIGFIDDRWPQLQSSFAWPVLGSVAALADFTSPMAVAGAIAAVGNNGVRARWLAAIRAVGLEPVTVIHPHASVSASARIGAGTAVMAKAMVGVDVQVGEGAIINAGCVVDHDATLGDFAHLGVGVHLAGSVRVGARAWLQAGSCAGYHVCVPDDAVYAPGSVLLVEP